MAPQGVVPVWQIKWVVYVSGRRYSICYQLDQAFKEARLLVNDIEIMRKAYKAMERVSASFCLQQIPISQACCLFCLSAVHLDDLVCSNVP